MQIASATPRQTSSHSTRVMPLLAWISEWPRCRVAHVLFSSVFFRSALNARARSTRLMRSGRTMSQAQG